MSLKWKYILLYAEGWALVMALVVSLFDHYFSHLPVTWRDVAIKLIIYSVIGVAVGAVMWKQKQRRSGSGTS